ncbi:MAG: hypothetical protein J0J03_08275 [Leifsonia sp.]|nr:hypothetical protein [Leifsonia sp.]
MRALMAGVLGVMLAALAACSPIYVPTGDLDGRWTATSAAGDVATLDLHADGSFQGVGFPIGALGAFPREVRWDQTSDVVGSWRDDQSGTLQFDFEATDSTGRYVGSALVVATIDGPEIRFPISSDEGIYLDFVGTD